MFLQHAKYLASIYIHVHICMYIAAGGWQGISNYMYGVHAYVHH